MKRLLLTSTLALAGLSLGGCATPSTPHHGPLPGSPSARVVELPGVPGPGEPRQQRLLVDEPALKLATIVLRGGTPLPAHQSRVPVTIVALRGSGAVLVGSERHRLDATHAVVLAANVPHAVEPDAGGDLVLLVHHLGPGEGSHP